VSGRGLVNGDEHRRPGSGCALEACLQRCAIQIHVHFTNYVTLLMVSIECNGLVIEYQTILSDRLQVQCPTPPGVGQTANLGQLNPLPSARLQAVKWSSVWLTGTVYCSLIIGNHIRSIRLITKLFALNNASNMYYFTCISFAIRPSGRKSAIKLIESWKVIKVKQKLTEILVGHSGVEWAWHTLCDVTLGGFSTNGIIFFPA